MNEEKIRTTVVIPNYNGEKYIEACLASVLRSSAGVRVIVVDNGSTDSSVDIIQSRFPKVGLVRLDENTGFCHAVNEGIKQSDTEFVYLLNNDTTIMHDTIKHLEETMDEHKNAFSVQSKMLDMYNRSVVDSAGDYYCILGWAFSYGKDRNASYYEHGVKQIFSACAGAAMYRTKELKDIGLFDEAHFAYLEDVDLGYRANLHGYRNYVNYDSEVLHAGSASSGSRYNNFKARYSARNSVYLIYKNMPVMLVLLNLPFLLAGFLIKTLFYIKKGLGSSYINGLFKGLDMCVSGKYSDKRVKVRSDRIADYLLTQLMMITGLARKFL